jgi:hypothetical protein
MIFSKENNLMRIIKKHHKGCYPSFYPMGGVLVYKTSLLLNVLRYGKGSCNLTGHGDKNEF